MIGTGRQIFEFNNGNVLPNENTVFTYSGYDMTALTSGGSINKGRIHKCGKIGAGKKPKSTIVRKSHKIRKGGKSHKTRKGGKSHKIRKGSKSHKIRKT